MIFGVSITRAVWFYNTSRLGFCQIGAALGPVPATCDPLLRTADGQCQRAVSDFERTPPTNLNDDIAHEKGEATPQRCVSCVVHTVALHKTVIHMYFVG